MSEDFDGHSSGHVWLYILIGLASVILVSLIMWGFVRSGTKGRWTDSQKKRIKPLIHVAACSSGKEDEVRTCVVDQLAAKYDYEYVSAWLDTAQTIHDMKAKCSGLCLVNQCPNNLGSNGSRTNSSPNISIGYM